MVKITFGTKSVKLILYSFQNLTEQRILGADFCWTAHLKMDRLTVEVINNNVAPTLGNLNLNGLITRVMKDKKTLPAHSDIDNKLILKKNEPIKANKKQKLMLNN
jgi:hypothetical protein